MRVGIVGAGTMGAAHAAAWRSTKARLIGCSSAHQSQSDQLAWLHGIRSYRAFTDLLQEVDIVDICTPTATHRSMVLEAAHAGKHVLCEKPVALREEDAQAMIQACDEAGVRFFVCMVVCIFPQYRLATAEDALQSLRIALAARASINTNQLNTNQPATLCALEY